MLHKDYELTLFYLLMMLLLFPAPYIVPLLVGCDDFHLLDQEVTFHQGATTGSTQSASVNIIDDSLVEGTESFVISGNVTAPASFVPGGDTTTVNIMDNDGECAWVVWRA